VAFSGGIHEPTGRPTEAHAVSLPSQIAQRGHEQPGAAIAPGTRVSAPSPQSTWTVRSYQRKFAAQAAAANSPRWPSIPAPEIAADSCSRNNSSACEPHRAFIKAQLRLRRNAAAVYQNPVDQHGFTGAYNSDKRFVARARRREPEQFEFLPGEEMLAVNAGDALDLSLAGARFERRAQDGLQGRLQDVHSSCPLGSEGGGK